MTTQECHKFGDVVVSVANFELNQKAALINFVLFLNVKLRGYFVLQIRYNMVMKLC